MKYAKISIIIKSSQKLPYFIGSQIRGALGHSLKKIVCINPSFSCQDCFNANACIYYEFYEKKNEYHKYRLAFDLGKDYYDFDFYLFEEAVNKLPYLISSLIQMLTKTGLGRDKIKYQNFDIFINNKDIYNSKQIKIPANYIQDFLYKDFCSNISLEFTSPLRIKKNNFLLKNQEQISKLSLKDFLNSIYQRSLRLKNLETKSLDFEPHGEIIKRDLFFQELRRKSSRQNVTMSLGGIMGKIELRNLDEQSFKLLNLGELIALGKQSVFGLGNIKIRNIDEQNSAS